MRRTRTGAVAALLTATTLLVTGCGGTGPADPATPDEVLSENPVATEDSLGPTDI